MSFNALMRLDSLEQQEGHYDLQPSEVIPYGPGTM